MSRDPNMVWGGSQDEHAKMARKIERVRSRIDSYKRLIDKDKNGRWPDKSRQDDLAAEMARAVDQLTRLQVKYDTHLVPWGK